MKLLITIILITSASITLAQDFNIPEILCYIQGVPEGETQFGAQFCWVGDQNGDGFDDLLIQHDPDSRNRGRANRVELFFGGEEMNDEPDFFFNTEEENYGIGLDLVFLGNLIPDHYSFITLLNYYSVDENSQTHVTLYEGGEELDNEPEFLMHRRAVDWADSTQYLYDGHRTRPTDFNGDGFHDLIVVQKGLHVGELQVYFGGEEFDTIPDWRIAIERPWNISPGTRISGGYDVNDDGYDDILIQAKNPYEYFLYLGGDPPDSLAALTFDRDNFDQFNDPPYINAGFSLLPDMNGDGYDEWGIHFNDGGNDGRLRFDGYFIFLGDEEPDIEVDVILEGNYQTLGSTGDISGGDFNGDGYGDVVTGLSGGYHGNGEVHLHFGRPELRDRMDADIEMNGEFILDEELFEGVGQLVGAVGDYNGDGVDDFVTRIGREINSICIFAGNDEWQVNNVDSELPVSYDLSLNAYPNPFNDTVKISFEIPSTGEIKLSIYDIQGQLLDNIINDPYNQGTHTTIWNAKDYPSGIYFAVLGFTTGDITEIKIEKLILLR